MKNVFKATKPIRDLVKASYQSGYDKAMERVMLVLGKWEEEKISQEDLMIALRKIINYEKPEE